LEFYFDKEQAGEEMGWCYSLLKVILYTSATLGVLLTYFHIECQREKEAKDADKFNEIYLPDQTDIETKLRFIKKGTKEVEISLGPEFILTQFCPCAIVKMITKVRHSINGHADLDQLQAHQENHTVTILDARKHKPGTFSETGFTIVTLDEEPGTKNWRYGSKDIHLFQEMMNPHLMKLYPKTKVVFTLCIISIIHPISKTLLQKILWLNNVVRGGDKPGDQPVAPSPHLDYFQDDEARHEFHKTFPLINPEHSERNVSEGHVLTGHYDTEDLEARVMLGVWKPLSPTEVCDFPLAVMDARTFNKENEVPFAVHVNFIFMMFHSLGGSIIFDTMQKWYYYSMQTTKEVLVFHQYTKDKYLANPHTSFANRNCPKSTESRISIESRVALFF